jgi:hypothetical protein
MGKSKNEKQQRPTVLVGSLYMPHREQKHLDELSKSLEKIGTFTDDFTSVGFDTNTRSNRLFSRVGESCIWVRLFASIRSKSNHETTYHGSRGKREKC